MAWLALAAGVGLQAIVTALMGISLTAADSLLLLVFAAMGATVSGRLLGRRHRQAAPAASSPSRSSVVKLNLWTAVMFLAFFLGVSTHGAAVMFTLEASLAPLAVLMWTANQSRRNACLPEVPSPQWVAAAVLAGLGVSLVAVQAHETLIGSNLLAGSALGVIAAVAAGGVIVVSRELGLAGVSVCDAMGIRFNATLALALAGFLACVPAGVLGAPQLHVGITLVAAFASIVIPMFLLQFAMQRLAPASITAVLATIPALTFGTELLSGQVVSAVAVLASLLIVPASLVLLLTQRAPEPMLADSTPMPESVAASARHSVPG